MWACRPWVWEIIYRMHKHPFAALCRLPGCLSMLRSPRYTREGPKLLPSFGTVDGSTFKFRPKYVSHQPRTYKISEHVAMVNINTNFFPEARLSVERLQAENLRGSLFTQLVRGECFQMKLFSAWGKKLVFSVFTRRGSRQMMEMGEFSSLRFHLVCPCDVSNY